MNYIQTKVKIFKNLKFRFEILVPIFQKLVEELDKKILTENKFSMHKSDIFL